MRKLTRTLIFFQEKSPSYAHRATKDKRKVLPSFIESTINTPPSGVFIKIMGVEGIAYK